ncbi:MAG TPA: hypothetical protein VFO06_09550 [Gemmatimonadales bacterium]|nr:hypothetical protein [Gemmatimonadales bacterium]
MQTLPLRRPVAAEVGLRRAAIGPAPPMQCAIDTVDTEVAAGGNDLDVQGILFVAHDLAEVWRLAGADQCFLARVLTGAENFNLEVPAAGGAA